MKLKKSYDPCLLEFSGGFNARTVFGLIFLAGGCLALCSPWLFPARMNVPFQMYIFGGVVTFLGLLLTGYCSGFTFDQNMSEMVDWWGYFGISLSQKRQQFADILKIKISKKVHRNKNRTWHTYPVSCVLGEENEKMIADLPDQISARRYGEAIAKHLKLSLLDASTHTETERPYDELDLSIRERAKKSGSVPKLEDIGEIPASLREYGGIQNGNLHLELPPSLFCKLRRLIMIPAMVLPLFIMLGFLFFSGFFRSAPLPVIFIFGGVLTVGMLGAGFAIWRAIGARAEVTEIHAEKHRLTLTFEKNKLEWEAHEIEELVLMDPPPDVGGNTEFARTVLARVGLTGITVRSDRLYRTFAGQLGADQQEWLYKALYAILAG